MDHQENNGKRWYDTSKVLALMMGFIWIIVLTWAGIVWNSARSAELKNVQQDEQIKNLQEAITKFDTKLDKVLDRLPIK
jgi:hypothetical protein